MKILLIHHRYRERGGEDFAVDRELALLRAGGHEVRLLEKDSRELEAAGPWAQARAAWELPYSATSRELVRKEIDAFAPDLVHAHNLFPTFTPAIYDACAEARVPAVQTLHNYRIFCASALLARENHPCELCLGGSPLPALRHACYQGSRLKTLALTRLIGFHRKHDTWNQKVARFVALSEFSRRKFVQGGLRAEKILVKPNFCFPPSAPPPQEREGFALFVGRLSEEKGVLPLLAAWRSLEIPLVIAGDGPLRQAVEAENNPRIRLLGRQPPEEISRLMHRASFLVLPSTCYENFPLVVAEAFAHGLPVAAVQLGSLEEIVSHGENGLHFRAGDSASLREAAIRLQGDKALRERLGEGALAAYRRLYTPERNLQRLLEIYRSAAAG